MPNNISTLQNDPGFLNMLHAQMQLYSEVKQTIQYRFYVSFLLALFPIVVFLLDWLQKAEWMPVLISVVTAFLFPAYLKRIEQKKIQLASAIQEQHDVKLFGIDWNESLVGNRPLQEDIDAADKRYKGVRKKDWYEGVPSQETPERAAVFCQKQNLSWDTRMREDYSRRFIVFGIAGLALPVIFAVVAGLPFIDYLVKLLAPTAPLLYLCYENFQSHQSRAAKQEAKAHELEMRLHGTEPITKEFVRKTQDDIYKFRQETMLIPDEYAEDWRKKNRS